MGGGSAMDLSKKMKARGLDSVFASAPLDSFLGMRI